MMCVSEQCVICGLVLCQGQGGHMDPAALTCGDDGELVSVSVCVCV